MDGVLVIDKPEGWTSHDVVARVRRVLRERRVGHTGTLDPFATGVLVVLVGRATRLAQFLSGAEKEYEAVIRLGYSTTTGDLTGERREAAAPSVDCSALTPEQIEAALSRLRGEIEQVPPMYSAKKVAGRKLYELARRGEEIERQPVRVLVSVFEVVTGGCGAWARRGDDGTCDLRARVVCSAGTYVRSLAESLGELLGTGAHLAALRRTRAGALCIEQSLTLERLEELASSGVEFLTRPDAALPGMPSRHLTAEEARSALIGRPVGAAPLASGELEEGEHVRLLGEDGRLLSVGVYDSARGLVWPRVTLAAGK
ncbi:MAG TPA: tRNA pseudouridine(55) synthase TruB [Pyrinomonadaceae bacterium]|nr:tRNA pseudouridine(55) synthase TruB [Pyrinomonadaceae bacterium]